MMQLGNAAWGLRETPLERQAELTASMGLELLELSIAGYERDYLQLDAGPEQLENVRNIFKRHQIRLECACTGNDFTGDTVDEEVTKVRRVIDIAAELGVKRLRIFAGFSSDSVVHGDRFTTLLDALRCVAEHAEKCGVLLAVETHGGVTVKENGVHVHYASVSTRADCWQEMLKTGVSINFDPANLAAVGAADPTAFYRRFREAIRYVHLKDFRSVPGGVLPAACGEGRLNWPELLKTLTDYDGPALIEYEITGDVEDGMRRSLAFLRAGGVR